MHNLLNFLVTISLSPLGPKVQRCFPLFIYVIVKNVTLMTKCDASELRDACYFSEYVLSSRPVFHYSQTVFTIDVYFSFGDR